MHLRYVLPLLIATAGCSSMTPGNLQKVQTTSERPLAGNVYLLRGFIGIWSHGIDHLGNKIESAGIRAHVYQEDQWQDLAEAIIRKYKGVNDYEPVVLIGHSYGADDTIRIARRLEEHKVMIDMIVTLDPVTHAKVPKNVRLCYNIYQPSLLDGFPFFRGVPLETDAPGNLQNVNIRAERRDLLDNDTDHFNIEKKERIHAEVIRKLRELCPPRAAWAAQRRNSIPPLRAPEGARPQGNGRLGVAEPVEANTP